MELHAGRSSCGLLRKSKRRGNRGGDGSTGGQQITPVCIHVCSPIDCDTGTAVFAFIFAFCRARESPASAAQNFLAHLRRAIPQCGQQRQCAFIILPHHLACKPLLNFVVRFAGETAGKPLAAPGVDQLRDIYVQQSGTHEFIVRGRADKALILFSIR
jgi:hypothetical protein